MRSLIIQLVIHQNFAWTLVTVANGTRHVHALQIPIQSTAMLVKKNVPTFLKYAVVSIQNTQIVVLLDVVRLDILCAVMFLVLMVAALLHIQCAVQTISVVQQTQRAVQVVVALLI